MDAFLYEALNYSYSLLICTPLIIYCLIKSIVSERATRYIMYIYIYTYIHIHMPHSAVPVNKLNVLHRLKKIILQSFQT